MSREPGVEQQLRQIKWILTGMLACLAALVLAVVPGEMRATLVVIVASAVIYLLIRVKTGTMAAMVNFTPSSVVPDRAGMVALIAFKESRSSSRSGCRAPRTV